MELKHFRTDDIVSAGNTTSEGRSVEIINTGTWNGRGQSVVVHRAPEDEQSTPETIEAIKASMMRQRAREAMRRRRTK